ncbi:MAG: hypothetical protein AB7Q81_00710 [Gammaproteobacteria bacterium]
MHAHAASEQIAGGDVANRVGFGDHRLDVAMVEALLDLVTLENTLRHARRTLGPDVTLQRLLILMAVYRNEGASQSELLAVLEGTSITALSRNLADVGELTSRKTTGPGLVELRVDPTNLRRKHIYLTPRGRRFFARWSKVPAQFV